MELQPSREKRFTATDACCAILGKRAIDALSVEAAEPSRRVSNVSHVVSRHAALTVIERWPAKE